MRHVRCSWRWRQGLGSDVRRLPWQAKNTAPRGAREAEEGGRLRVERLPRKGGAACWLLPATVSVCFLPPTAVRVCLGPTVYCCSLLPCACAFCRLQLSTAVCQCLSSFPLQNSMCGNRRMPHACACAADAECGSGRCASCATALRPEASRYPSSSRHPF